MKHLIKGFILFSRVVAAIIVFALIAVAVTSVTLIYDFGKPQPFSGPDIFNPYRNVDSTYNWKKANFHVHTRVKGILNECEYWPADVYKAHERLGYDIVTFSNHNELTTHPFDSTLQVNVYEHGYNIFKFHKLVFGSKDVNRFDHLLPLFVSQKQFQMDMLGKECDIIQYNHPLRTTGTSKSHMEKLEGYHIMELDCGKSTENEFWDWALSAGHYSFGLANDDLHFPDRTNKIARRCNFVFTPTGRYEDIRKALLDGCYYSMRIPDYGKGDWKIKIEKNKNLPYITEIGNEQSSIHVSFSQVADSIKVFGQGHSLLYMTRNSDKACYNMDDRDCYARFTAYFPGGEVIYTNPFARYDASAADSPMRMPSHKVNTPLTILFNAALLAVFSGLVLLFCKITFNRIPLQRNRHKN